MADRSLRKVVEYYRTGVKSFVAFALAPPLDSVGAGEFSVQAAMPILLSLHEDALKRVGNDTDRVLPKAVRKAGAAVVNETVLEELAHLYGVTVQNLHQAQAMQDSGSEIPVSDQPESDGGVDFHLLRSECENVLNEKQSQRRLVWCGMNFKESGRVSQASDFARVTIPHAMHLWGTRGNLWRAVTVKP